MNLKYIFAVFLTAAFFMTGCSSGADNTDNMGNMDGAGMRLGDDILGNGTTDRDGEMTDKTGYGSNDNFMSYGTDGYYDNNMDGIYGSMGDSINGGYTANGAGTNGGTGNGTMGGTSSMAAASSTGANY